MLLKQLTLKMPRLPRNEDEKPGAFRVAPDGQSVRNASPSTTAPGGQISGYCWESEPNKSATHFFLHSSGVWAVENPVLAGKPNSVTVTVECLVQRLILLNEFANVGA